MNILTKIKKGMHYDIVFLKSKSTHDDCEIFLAKLCFMALKSTARNQFRSCLVGRKQTVEIKLRNATQFFF